MFWQERCYPLLVLIYQQNILDMYIKKNGGKKGTECRPKKADEKLLLTNFNLFKFLILLIFKLFYLPLVLTGLQKKTIQNR